MTLPRPSIGTNTRSVTPGIENQDPEEQLWAWIDQPGVYAGLDWFRITARDSFRPQLLRFLQAWFGDDTRETPGAKFFRAGCEWHPGVQLSWGHSEQICMVDVRGERFTMLGGDDGNRLLCEFMNLGIPIKPTRIDLALDYVQQGRDICAQALESCERGELCGLRRWSRDDEYTAQGYMTRKLLKLGKRESAVCARIYDKGRQKKIPEKGLWERMEVEFKGDRAPQVMVALVDSGAHWISTLEGLVLGAFDFRVVNGRSERLRRPRATWWECLLAGCAPRAVPADPEPHSAQKWLEGFQRSYGRALKHLAAELGIPVGHLVEEALCHTTSHCSRPDLVPGLRGMGFGQAESVQNG